MRNGFMTPEGHENFEAKKLFDFGADSPRLQWSALAYIQQGGGGPAGGHRHESGHIFIVTEGEVRVMVGEEAHTVHKDESFVVAGGALHSIWNDREETAKVTKLNVL